MSKETDGPTIDEVLNSPFTEQLTPRQGEKRIRKKKEPVRKQGRPEGTKGFIPVSCYLPPELKADIQADAERERRTMNGHIIHILTNYLKRKKKGGIE